MCSAVHALALRLILCRPHLSPPTLPACLSRLAEEVCSSGDLPGFIKGDSDCLKHITFQLPTNVEASTNGGLVKCRHWLEVRRLEAVPRVPLHVHL